MKKDKIRVLFLCKHNRFRSKVAEYLFKKYNKSKKIKVNSAGINPDFLLVSSNVTKVLRKYGIYKINRKPNKISKKLINNSDLIVIVANNIKIRKGTKFPLTSQPSLNLEGKKVIVWKIKDTSQHDYPGILKRTKLIEKRIKKLVSMLKYARIA